MDEIPALTRAEIDLALKQQGLQDIGLTVTKKHWFLGNEMGNLRMPIGHLIQTCLTHLKQNGLPLPHPPIKEIIPVKKTTKKEIAA